MTFYSKSWRHWTSFVQFIIFLVHPGCAVWRKLEKCEVQHLWRDPPCRRDPQRWRSNHPHGKKSALRFHAHCWTQADGACLPCGNPGLFKILVTGVLAQCKKVSAQRRKLNLTPNRMGEEKTWNFTCFANVQFSHLMQILESSEVDYLLFKDVLWKLCWNKFCKFLISNWLVFSALRMLLVESTGCWTGGEDMCLRRHRLPAPPCSWSRPTCLLTSPLASQPTCVPTLEARLSRSACSTTGRSFQAVPFLMAPNPTRCRLDLLRLLDKIVKVD